MVNPDWNLSFDLMCDASDYRVGPVLGQRSDKKFQPIYYARKTWNPSEESYTTTEKEMLAVVFSFDNFRSYLVLLKTMVCTDYTALKYLFNKPDATPRILKWVLLLQKFDIQIVDKKCLTSQTFQYNIKPINWILYSIDKLNWEIKWH